MRLCRGEEGRAGRSGGVFRVWCGGAGVGGFAVQAHVLPAGKTAGPRTAYPRSSINLSCEHTVLGQPSAACLVCRASTIYLDGSIGTANLGLDGASKVWGTQEWMRRIGLCMEAGSASAVNGSQFEHPAREHGAPHMLRDWSWRHLL